MGRLDEKSYVSVGLLIAIIAAAVTFGVLSNKVEANEKRIEKMEGREITRDDVLLDIRVRLIRIEDRLKQEANP